VSPSYFIALIALTVLMEARGQPRLGQEMVAWVVVNRMEVSGLDAESVLMQPGQFAVWNDHELRMRLLRCAALGRFPDDPGCVGIPGGIGGTAGWGQTYRMVEDIYLGRADPPFGMEGTLNFDNPAFWPNGLPPWLKGDCAQVGDHLFCRPRR
jgi:hypothetical protein